MQILKTLLRWLFAAIFVFAGALHFAMPEFYLRIMPPYLPWHHALVYLSGLFEIVLGILLVIPRFRTLAAWGLVVLLVAIFPANLHMALNPEQYPEVPPLVLWLRLPLQGLLIAWAYWLRR